MIASREQSTENLNRYIKKLGNPILFIDSQSRVWLFYVTVSFGGWSGSSIAVRYSDDDGVSWSPAKRLVTSPFLNVSTLVKGAPIESSNGEILLPVYHELLRKFSELLVINPEGDLVRKHRLTATHCAIQPCLVPRDTQSVQVFYRQNGLPERRVLTQRTSDLSSPKSPPLELTDISNPDSAVSVVRRKSGGFVMVCNPLDFGRHRLSIATSKNGIEWNLVHDIEHTTAPDEFSYPYLIADPLGRYHLIYTWNRTRMRHVFFNESWLETRN